MIKRNIAIGILILIIVVVFAVAIINILPHGKSENVVENKSNQPVMRVSDVIEEAVYMGSYTSDTEIYAEEQFAAKDVLRSALAKSSGLPENVTVMIESHNYEDLSVVFDDGKTMRVLEQPGSASVVIVALMPKLSGDVYYAYNVQINVKESRTVKTTEVTKTTGPAVSRAAQKVTAAWRWEEEDVTTAAVTKVWSKVTTAAVSAGTGPAVSAKPSDNPVTEVPVQTEPSSAPEPEQPAEPSVDPEPEQPADPPAEPEPEQPANPEPPSDAGQE